MKPLRTSRLLPALLAAFITTANAEPYIGFVYPAGGKAGTTFEVQLGGQRLTRITGATVTGEGIQTEFLEYIEPIDRTIRKARNARQTVLSEIEEKKAGGESVEGIKIPEVPMRKRNPRAQPNAQIEETVLIRVSISPDAEPGKREIRVMDKRGVSNPIVFHVGVLDEIIGEPQPVNIRKPHAPTELKSIPMVLNGRVMPGETDRFRFPAKKGQHLVMITHARALIPYLADAVPGWFQAVISVHDTAGNEVAYSDDYRFDPDPVLFFDPPADGTYELRIRDAIYRGREDFVYRIAMGELPFVKGIFPLGGKVGTDTDAALSGINLTRETLKLTTAKRGINAASMNDAGTVQEIPYAIDELSEMLETEPNNSPARGQQISVPSTVNGRIQGPGDVDVFTFQGHKGTDFVAEILARRLNSPLDSIITLTDSGGGVIAANDDHKDKAAGLLTHHADSYLSCKLPRTDQYRIEVRDVQNKGGDYYAYRLRLGTKHPDFALRVVPSNISVPIGGSAPITVHVLRKDGFDGPVEIGIQDQSSEVLSLNGVVPAGADRARLTVSAGRKAVRGVNHADIIGTAHINGDRVTHRGIPADDRMQAFLWRFLVPAEELALSIRWADKVALMPQLAPNQCLQIPAGDSVSFLMKLQTQAKGRKAQASMTIGLDNPPAGISMQAVEVTGKDRQVRLTIDADDDVLTIGQKGYLIVAGLAGKQNVVVGMAPAIPYEIVE